MTAYLERIYLSLKANSSIMITGLILFDKFINKHAFDLKQLNYHKLIFISIMMAHKFNEDMRNKFKVSIFFKRILKNQWNTY